MNQYNTLPHLSDGTSKQLRRLVYACANKKSAIWATTDRNPGMLWGNLVRIWWNRSFAARGHTVQNATYWRARECDKTPLGNLKKEKSHFFSYLCFYFGVWYILLRSSMALYHVTSSCKKAYSVISIVWRIHARPIVLVVLYGKRGGRRFQMQSGYYHTF